jgi:hypothetical protein
MKSESHSCHFLVISGIMKSSVTSHCKIALSVVYNILISSTSIETESRIQAGTCHVVLNFMTSNYALKYEYVCYFQHQFKFQNIKVWKKKMLLIWINTVCIYYEGILEVQLWRYGSMGTYFNMQHRSFINKQGGISPPKRWYTWEIHHQQLPNRL